jgi:CHAT domain-containing protein
LGDNGLVVGDPDTAGASPPLPAARAEALAIAATFYPAGSYLGRAADGSATAAPGTRAEVVTWLADPGAGTVAHFACHGVTEPGNACLVLADGTRLTADELTETLTRTAGRDVALAVLAACDTGRSARGYDEAFSLGSAFLAANVRSVISTLWSIPDDATSVLMFMLHHFLRAKGLPPAEALRATQLWALHDRTPPPSMPDSLKSNMTIRRVDAPESWAAFVHFGQ